MRSRKGIVARLLRLFSTREHVLTAQLLGLMVVGAILETAGVGAIPAFVALLSRPEAVVARPAVAGLLKTFGIAADSGEVIHWACIALVSLFLLKNGYLTFLAYANAGFVARMQVSLSQRLFGAYMHAPYTFHLQRNSAELLRNVKGEVGEVLHFVLAPVLSLCMDALIVIFILAVLTVVDPAISAIAVILLGGTSVAFLTAIRKKVRKYGKIRHHLRKQLIQYFKQGLGGLKETRVLGREDYFVGAFVDVAREYANATRYNSVVRSLPARVIETIAIGGLLLVVLFMVIRGTDIAAFVPVLALFAVAALRLMPSFKRIVNAMSNIKYHEPALDSLYKDLQELETAKAREKRSGGSMQFPLQQGIELRDLRYRYPDSEAFALEGITLTIPRGAAVAFVGSSGAGKTTLANLLLGLLEPTAGRILVDGRDIQNNLPSWQRKIGLIPQSPYLADDSIRRNIAFGIYDEDIDDARVAEVVVAAQLESLITSLPSGLDTLIGEDGVRLSGGQRQRIAIARALYHDPDVIIMDEGTSALDNETERYVMQALDRLRADRTIIMIAHRLTTVKNCDRLFVLGRGKIVAEGSYEELLAGSNEFRTIAAA